MSTSTARTVVALSGDLTISRSEELRECLLAGFSAGMAVHVDCSAALSADVSFLQLIVAARASAARRGVGLTVAAPPDGPVAAAARAAGMAPLESSSGKE